MGYNGWRYGLIFNGLKEQYKMSEGIEISKLIDRYLPADGIGTEREQIRMEMHNNISMLVKNLTIPHVINSATAHMRYTFEEEFRFDHPETVGETDSHFDLDNYKDWLEVQLIEARKQLALYSVSYCDASPEDIADNYYTAECSKCGWWGSSKLLYGGGAIADTGDYFDGICPVCGNDNIDERYGN